MANLTKPAIALVCAVALVIVGVGAFWVLKPPPQPSDQELSESSRKAGDASVKIDGQPSSEDPFSSRRTSTQEPEAFKARISEQLYGVNENIVESWRIAATELGWSYDELADNLALWEPLCSDAISDPRVILGVRGIAQTAIDRIHNFCDGFSEWKATELAEYDFVHEAEVLAGNSPYQKMISEVSKLPEDRKFEHLIRSLEKALDQHNEAGVINIVGHLAFAEHVSLPQLSSPEAKTTYQLGYNLQSVLAASAILMCEHLAGCETHHPIIFRLCVQILDRRCVNPRDIYHAASQLLTGLEAELVVHLLTRVDQLRIRYAMQN